MTSSMWVLSNRVAEQWCSFAIRQTDAAACDPSENRIVSVGCLRPIRTTGVDKRKRGQIPVINSAGMVSPGGISINATAGWGLWGNDSSR